VVNSIGGQRGVVAHRGGCLTVVGGRPDGNGGGGDGRWLVVREGGIRWHGARGGDVELGGGPGAALHGGSMVAEQGGAVGTMGGRKKCCSRGVGLPL
jgi:hypothetical protein